MNREKVTELFILKCAALRLAVDEIAVPLSRRPNVSTPVEASLDPFVSQFPEETRVHAHAMAEHYRLFYMLENDIRKLIDSVMTEAKGADWWASHAPGSAKEECRSNQQREAEAGVTSRSENELDYISFGQLGEIMRTHWGLFGGVLSNQKAMGRVMFGLNMLRGPIAHCGLLADDEVDRLHLTVKDWFRLLEGPK